MNTNEPARKPRGFAAMTPERHREICAMGGKKAHELGKGHKYTSEQARSAGKKGGATVAADRVHMAQIGAMGGHATSRSLEHMASMGRLGAAALKARREAERAGR